MANKTSFTSYMQRERHDDPNLTVRGRKRTKVVATLGPATDDPVVLRGLYHAGMNVARFNMSHGRRADQERRLDMVRTMSDELERPVASLVDLQGPKIRLTTFADGGAEWPEGFHTVITVDPCLLGSAERIGTTYAGLADDVGPGDTILVDDGRLRLLVQRVEGPDVHCVVKVGGQVSDSKGINLPGVQVSAQALTDKDIEDLNWAIQHQVDYLALSFVSCAQDIKYVRRRIQEAGRQIPIIAKIEREEAVRNMEEIIRTADGIMVARGDLGIELSTQRLPVIQKHLITRANAHGKFVITATQMLESMITNPIPTRAESSDVANAIFDGTDAIMLSGETSIGAHPVKAVEEMLRIAIEAEESPYMPPSGLDPAQCEIDRISLAVTGAATHLARDIDAAGVMVFSHGSQKTELLAKLRCPGRIIPLCYDVGTWRRLAAIWGTVALRVAFCDDPHELLEAGIREAKRQGAVNDGDTLVVLMGFGSDGANSIKIVNV